MKYVKTRIMAAMLAIVMTVGVLASPVHAATSKNSLKNLNISWDLKNNKAVKFKTAVGKCDANGGNFTYTYLVQAGTITMKNYKVTNAKKSGYKKLTFTLVYDFAPELSKKLVDKMVYFERLTDASNTLPIYWTIADYATGEDLSEVDKDVKLTYGEWKYAGKKTDKGTGNRSITHYTKATEKVTVVYPETYKNLCILAGGQSSLVDSGTGSTLIKKQTELYSKKDKRVCHGFRVK